MDSITLKQSEEEFKGDHLNEGELVIVFGNGSCLTLYRPTGTSASHDTVRGHRSDSLPVLPSVFPYRDPNPRPLRCEAVTLHHQWRCNTFGNGGVR